MKCGDCRFYDAWEQNPKEGLCRSGGPVVVTLMPESGIRFTTAWPSVSADSDWCGQFDARPDLYRCERCRWWEVAEDRNPAFAAGEPRGICRWERAEPIPHSNTAASYHCAGFEPREEVKP